MKLIINKCGGYVSYDSWAQQNKVSKGKLSPHFSIAEFAETNGEFIVSETLITLLELIRKEVKHPLRINSGYRSPAHQKALRNDTIHAAASTWTSPHVYGLAADIDTITKEQSVAMAESILKVSKQAGIKARIGFKQYMNKGQTFVHVDVAPEYYGANGGWADLKTIRQTHVGQPKILVPAQWKSTIIW